ncbi:MAG: 50S ribosomal protein L25/general stress protein Ctc [Alphaproteobacteria bacterium]|nr:MAG: 50S ribosomal protein L25/general stress protein Ctc [Alphaproteobacteria bacterium]
MSQTTVALAAQRRDRAGKGAARTTRRANRVPAVIYGGGETPVMLSLDGFEVVKTIRRAGFFSHIIELDVDGTKHRVLPRDIQRDPVTDQPIHMDFLRVGKNTRVHTHVPMEFLNIETSPGIKRGGMLNIVLHEIDVMCSAENIPEKLVADIGSLDIGDTIHLSNVSMPKDVTPMIEMDTTIATIAAPSAQRSEEKSESGEGEGAAEGEKKAEGTPAAGGKTPASGDKGKAPAGGGDKGKKA